jgi:hypothetical protein
MEGEKITAQSQSLIGAVVIGYEITWAEIRLHDGCVCLIALGYLSSSGR